MKTTFRSLLFRARSLKIPARDCDVGPRVCDPQKLRKSERHRVTERAPACQVSAGRRPAVRAMVVTVALAAMSVSAASYFPLRPDDPRAVDFTKEAFSVHADGLGEDGGALQQADNRVKSTKRIGVELVLVRHVRLGIS